MRLSAQIVAVIGLSIFCATFSFADSLEDKEREAAALIDAIKEKQDEQHKKDVENVERRYAEQAQREKEEAERTAKDEQRASGKILFGDLSISVFGTAFFGIIGFFVAAKLGEHSRNEDAIIERGYYIGSGIVPAMLMFVIISNPQSSWIVGFICAIATAFLGGLGVHKFTAKPSTQPEGVANALPTEIVLKKESDIQKDIEEYEKLKESKKKYNERKQSPRYLIEFCYPIDTGLSLDTTLWCLDDDYGLTERLFNDFLLGPEMYGFNEGDYEICTGNENYFNKANNAQFALWINPAKYESHIKKFMITAALSSDFVDKHKFAHKELTVHFSQTNSGFQKSISCDIAQLGDNKTWLIGAITRDENNNMELTVINSVVNYDIRVLDDEEPIISAINNLRTKNG